MTKLQQTIMCQCFFDLWKINSTVLSPDGADGMEWLTRGYVTLSRRIDFPLTYPTGELPPMCSKTRDCKNVTIKVITIFMVSTRVF